MPKVVLITGASSGIGAALAREYGRRGAAVVLAARRQERLQALEQEITAQGGRALAVEADVTDQASLDRAVALTLERFGRLDVLIANAGFSVAAGWDKLELEDYQRQFDTNIYGVLRTIRAGLEALKASRGRVVLMGSVAGHVSAPGSTPYSMSKFAVRALAEGLRPELGDWGVGLTLISPGFVESEIRQVDNQGRLREGKSDPLPRLLTMSSARAARHMISAIERGQSEAVITLHGKLLVWLSRHFPGLLRMLLSRFRRGPDKSVTFRRRQG